VADTHPIRLELTVDHLPLAHGQCTRQLLEQGLDRVVFLHLEPEPGENPKARIVLEVDGRARD
jgi:hypothetical protein